MFTSTSLKIIPPTTINKVIQTISVTNLLTNFIASSLPFFDIISLKTGINAADITPPIMTSNNVVGIVDAVKNASDSKPEPKYAVKSESLTSPSTFDKSVAIASLPSGAFFVRKFFLSQRHTPFFIKLNRIFAVKLCFFF